MNILIVDDVEENIVLLKRILKRAGFDSIFSALSANDAYRVLEKEKIDLIYLDIIMPLTDGIETCKVIRKNPAWNEIPIIMITASDESDSIKEAFAVGANDYVKKPLDIVELIARTNVVLKMQYEIDARKNREKQIENELFLAKALQRSVLTPAINNKYISIDAYYEPSDNVGGDMYCLYEISEGEYGFLMYDVMGHGIASALVSMSIYSLTRGLITRLRDPYLVVSELNSHMHRLFFQNPEIGGYFITAIYLHINTKEKTIRYVNAGHPEGYSFSQGEPQSFIRSTTPFLGIMTDVPIEVVEITYEDEIDLFLYTDGLVEDLQPNQAINQERLGEIISSSNNVVESLVQEFHLNEASKIDDICFVLLKLK